MRDMISMNRFLQEPLLNTILKVYPGIYLSQTIALNGMNIARSDGKPFIDHSDKQYFKDIIVGKSVAWLTMIDKSFKKPSLILAVPIKKGDMITGVLVNAINLDDLSKRVITWAGGDTGSAFLVDEQDNVIAHKIDEYVRKQKNFGQHPLVAAFKNGKRGSISFTNNDGKLMLGHVRGTAFGWILAIQQEESEAFYLIDQLMSYAYLLLGVTAVFVFIIAWFSGRALSRPIIKLTHVADRISMGELDVEISTNRKDEIGNLAEAIARMQDSIRLSIERLRQMRQISQ
jgi:methyl-accepting chemotaxis protein